MSEPSLPTPGEEHKRLAPFLGRFQSTVKMWMGPGDPMVMTGVMENSWDLGGLYLRQHYQGDAADGPFPAFEGRGYWGYNGASGKYEGFWIDTASTTMQFEEGGFDPGSNQWEMIGEALHPNSGAPMKRRTIIELIDDDRHSMITYTTVDGEEQKTMEIQYVRQSDS